MRHGGEDRHRHERTDEAADPARRPTLEERASEKEVGEQPSGGRARDGQAYRRDPTRRRTVRGPRARDEPDAASEDDPAQREREQRRVEHQASVRRRRTARAGSAREPFVAPPTLEVGMFASPVAEAVRCHRRPAQPVAKPPRARISRGVGLCDLSASRAQAASSLRARRAGSTTNKPCDPDGLRDQELGWGDRARSDYVWSFGSTWRGMRWALWPFASRAARGGRETERSSVRDRHPSSVPSFTRPVELRPVIHKTRARSPPCVSPSRNRHRGVA